MNAQAGAQAPPPAPPTVIVINRDRREALPYMKRGTEMYGMVVRAGCMAISLTFAIIFLIFGLSMMSLLFTLKMFYIPLIMIIVFFSAGGFLLHLYITARRKAKREFDALPADHPDRVKYGGILLPGSVAASYPTANVYHFPSNAQGLGVAGPLAAAASSAPPSPGQQGSSAKGSDPPGGYPHQGPYPPPQGQYPHQGPYAPPQGQYPPPQGQYPHQGPYAPAQGQYPPPQGQYPHQGPYAPPQGQYPPPQGPSAPPQGSSAKYDDQPPPYTEI